LNDSIRSFGVYNLASSVISWLHWALNLDVQGLPQCEGVFERLMLVWMLLYT
jgi:hypothetical protein